MTKLEKISYGGWDNCYRLSNDVVDLVVTTDVGPRIIRFGFRDQGNMFKEYPHLLGKTGGDDFRIYGGHRFWHAPEDLVRTYYPDNNPVQLKEHGNFIRLVQPIETTTGVQKEIDISLSASDTQVTVTHRLRNTNMWSIEVAPWALSVMNSSGTAILPLPPRIKHSDQLLPTSSLILWGYVDMSDPRWGWGQEYILLNQDPTAATPQKVGLSASRGWLAYAHENGLLAITYASEPDAVYPDMGSCVEIFTDSDMLELETLGPLFQLAADATVEHVETWHLFEAVARPQNDSDVVANILPKIDAVIP